MKNLSLLSLLFTFIFFSCSKEEDPVPAAVACFTVDATESTDSTRTFLFDQCPPVYDLSYWDFDDGTYSSNPNPAHVFNHNGTFDVKLTVTNSAGQSNSATHTVVIGHYSLDKIVFTQATNTISYPKWLEFSPFSVYDSVNNASQLPWTHDFADGAVYDLIDSAQYIYAEQNMTQLTAQGFTVFPSSLSNKIYDASLTLLGDSAKFTMYYKIVGR